MVLFTASASPESIGSDVKVHMKHFGGEKVLMLMEPQERKMLSSVMKTMKWCVWEGIIFIMKNRMQTYDRKNEELQPEPQEKYEDQAVKDFAK